MHKPEKNKPYKNDELKITLLVVVFTVYFCVLFAAQADRFVSSHMSYIAGTSTSHINYMKQYLEYIEDIGPDIYENNIVSDSEKILYGLINDESSDCFFESIMRIRVAKLSRVTWIADKHDNESIIRSDYVVFNENDKSQLIVDLHACYSDEECKKIRSFFSENSGYILYLEKYVMVDDIAYPIMLSARKNGTAAAWFYPDIQIEYSENDIIECTECRVIDGIAVPSDSDYIEAGLIAREKYEYFCKRLSIPSDYIRQTRGYIVNVMVEDTDNLVGCQVVIVNYSEMLNAITVVGCIIITLIGSIIAYVLCKNVKNKRDKIEYERSVTSALAHNYKSSLMIIRSYAENLISGVSDDKKTQYEQIIIDETDRLNEITEKLLSLYRINNTDYRTLSDNIDASNVSKVIIKKYESITNERELQWQIEEESKFIINGDIILFSMAIDNLIGNSTKYALKGSTIKIFIKEDEMSIENRWNPIDKFIRKPQLLFEAFVTGDETPERSNSGIGLRVTRDILERMNMNINAITDQDTISFLIKQKHSHIRTRMIK